MSATDNGVNPGPLETYTTVTVTLTDYNDNPPLFSHPVVTVFYVPENEVAPYLINQVIATDMDTEQNGVILYGLDDNSQSKTYM